jgi:hypothetical protein
MLEVERHVKYADIASYIAQGELEHSLLVVKKRMDIAILTDNLDEQCRLNLFFAWIYYLYQYNPISVNYTHKVLRYRDKIDHNLVIQAYLIRSLVHLRHNKLGKVHDAIQECLRLNPNSEEAKTMQKILQSRINTI